MYPTVIVYIKFTLNLLPINEGEKLKLAGKKILNDYLNE